MNRLNNDELFSFAIHLELPELLSFCSASKKINNLICNKDPIWNYKLNKDFPNWDRKENFLNAVREKSLREIYTLLYKLTILKEKLKIEIDIYSLYFSVALILPKEGIEELPKEIGVLINLEDLYLQQNKLKTLPKEIGNLTRLRLLFLQNNEIDTLPKEIIDLRNLEYLSLKGNPLKNLSPETTKFLATYL